MTDKLSTEAIRDMIGAVEDKAHWIATACVSKARSELAAILKRNEELETENAVMRARLRRLLDASEHSGKMDWMGDDDPWGDAESAITRDCKLAELIGEGE